MTPERRVANGVLCQLAEAERRNQDAESALVTFQIALDGCKGISKIRNGPADSDLSDNRSLDTCQACLLGTHEHDQVEAWRVRFTTNTKRKVQRGLEVMAGIELLFGESIPRSRIDRQDSAHSPLARSPYFGLFRTFLKTEYSARVFG